MAEPKPQGESTFPSSIPNPTNDQLSHHSSQTVIAEASPYPGSGTQEDPYVVNFLPGEADDPRNFATWRKWTYMVTYALTMMAGTFSVSSYTVGIPDMIVEFGVSREALIVGQTTFLLGLAIGSLVFPGVADYAGRRWVLVVTTWIFALFTLGVALGHNLATELVCRFFAGFFASAAQAAGPSAVSSMFTPRQLAVPFTIAAIAPFLGPSLGPLIGSFVVARTHGWRDINWVSMALAGFMATVIAIIPETYSPVILARKAEELSNATGQVYTTPFTPKKKKTLSMEIRKFVVRPMEMLLFEPIVLLFSTYIGVLYGILNLFFSSYPRIYYVERHFSLQNSGLPFLGLIVGFLLSIPITLLLGYPYIKKVMTEGKAPPEMRLYFPMLAAICLPISLFWQAWTANPSIHWISPIMAGGLFGFSQIGLTMGIFTYFADVYGVDVGAVFAGMNMLRFAFGAVFPLFANQMYDRLGTAWASSLLGFLLILFLPAPFLFYIYGPKIRAMSRRDKKALVKADLEAANKKVETKP